MKKSLIANICLTAVSALLLVFLALPFVEGISGYKLFEGLQLIGYMPFEYKLLYLSPVLTLVFAIIALAFAVVNLLGDLNVIKSEKFLKVARIIMVVVAAILAVVALVTVIIVAVNGFAPAVGLILILIATAAAVAGSVLQLIWNRK